MIGSKMFDRPVGIETLVIDVVTTIGKFKADFGPLAGQLLRKRIVAIEALTTAEATNPPGGSYSAPQSAQFLNSYITLKDKKGNEISELPLSTFARNANRVVVPLNLEDLHTSDSFISVKDTAYWANDTSYILIIYTQDL